METEGWLWLEIQTQAAERLRGSERRHPGFKAPCSQVFQLHQTLLLCSLHLLPLPRKEIGGIYLEYLDSLKPNLLERAEMFPTIKLNNTPPLFLSMFS